MGKILFTAKKRNVITGIKYGLLYNWYVVGDARGIAKTGWHVPTRVEAQTLGAFLGGLTVAGGAMKETGLTYWISPNTGATNSSLFNGRGNGDRSSSGGFVSLQAAFWAWTTTPLSTTYYSMNLVTGGANLQILGHALKTGDGIRLIKDSTTLINGQTGTYIGNDGKVYRTICIGTQEWLADNLAETKFRNGDTIPFAGGNGINFTNAEWAALTTAGCCPYNNDWNNV